MRGLDLTGRGSLSAMFVCALARITPGRARLIGPAGCVSRAFHARVAGKKIARVIFILDGKKVLTLKRTNFHKTFAIRLDPRRLSIGVHKKWNTVRLEGLLQPFHPGSRVQTAHLHPGGSSSL